MTSAFRARASLSHGTRRESASLRLGAGVCAEEIGVASRDQNIVVKAERKLVSLKWGNIDSIFLKDQRSYSESRSSIKNVRGTQLLAL